MSIRKLITAFLFLTFWNEVLSRQLRSSNQSNLNYNKTKRVLEDHRPPTYQPSPFPSYFPTERPAITPVSNLLCGTNGVFELSNLNGVNGFVLNGETEWDLSGNAVKAIGDLNHDGISDFIVGAITADLNGEQSGKAYIVFGKNGLGSSGKIELSSLNGSNGFKLNGLAAYNWLGYASSALGDINNDGIDDMVIGASGAGINGVKSGTSYVIFGQEGIGASGTFDLSKLDGNNGFVMHGKSAGDEFGRALSSAGDFNHDGIKDIAIGALYADPNGDKSGASYIIYGNRTMGHGGVFNLNTLDGSNGVEIRGIQSGDQSGSAISKAGDINHDGIDDIMIKSFKPGMTPVNNVYPGVVYFVYGGTSVGNSGVFELSGLNGSNGFVVTGLSFSDNSGENFVATLSAASDVNADDIDDVIIGSPYSSPNGALSGASYVLFGHKLIGTSGTIDVATLNGSNGFALNGVAAGDNSGVSVSASDINNDGVSDLIIGAWKASPHGSASGASYLVYGKVTIGSGGTFQLSTLDGSNGFKANGIASEDGSGISVSAVGDVNNDGWNDFVIGAIYASPNSLAGAGSSYVVFCASQIFLPPSAAPSAIPTPNPTYYPSFRPTTNPTLLPSMPLTVSPTRNPTLRPSTQSPSMSLTVPPTLNPTLRPSTQSPSMPLTVPPTLNPTLMPSAQQTSLLTVFLTMMTSQQPTYQPTQLPTNSTSSHTTNNLLIILLAVLLPCLGISIFMLVYYYQRQKNNVANYEKPPSMEINDINLEAPPMPTPSAPAYLERDTTDSEEKQPDETPIPARRWRIPHSEIPLLSNENIIGRGSFGVVYAVTWKDQPVAVKSFVNQGKLSAEQAQKDDPHEVKVMQNLQHDCLVRFLGAVQEVNHYFMIVTEYCSKGSLENYLHDDLQDHSWWLHLRMAHELARGLAYLHESGVIHRDIKSPNVVLNGDYHAKWCDFGFAHLRSDPTLTSSMNVEIGTAAGTPRWIAPEQLDPPPVELSRKSDIWSFGMLLFELASREPPFASKQTQESVMAAIKRKTGERVPQECERRIPEFGRIMRRCWAEKNARPSAEELVTDLEALARSHPEPARP